MSRHFDRRTFLKHISYAGATLPLVAPGLVRAVSANEKLRHASVGGNGMAAADMNNLANSKEFEMVAIVDVDKNRITNSAKKFPNAKIYDDWRKMLDAEANNIDSVNVSIPDHMHAPVGVSAIQLGKHVYGQKPLGQNIYDTRQLQNWAKRNKVVTQMGIQIHSHTYYRLGVALVQTGAIGKIKEVHSFSGKRWGDMAAKPNKQDAVPDHLNWDAWLGVAKERPYIGGGYYHPGNWRKRLDFGTGTFGDMGCHIYDPVFEALGVNAAISVTSHGPKPNADNWAIDAKIDYIFPKSDYSAGDTMKVTWYDGGARPPQEIAKLLEGKNVPGQGSIFIGTKGVMLLPHIGRPELFPKVKFEDFDYPKVRGTDHWRQFVDACRGEGKTTADFDYAGPLTEAVLLGSLATHFPGQELKWDSKNLRVTNFDKANQYVKRPHTRKEWSYETVKV